MGDIKAFLSKMSGEKGGGDGIHKSTSEKAQTIEKIYQKKSQLEHILLRPDTYIGSVEHVTESMWIYDSTKEIMIKKKIEYVPGLYKIFDEILVNAADNKQRDKKMDCIKVDINSETNTISIWNNGKGIPVVMHKEENMFVPTMIFGHLLTSSNYNDEEMKVTGGRNGYGAKLCNIFSKKFVVETASKEYKRHYKQTWGDNMGKASEPKIKDFTGEDYTKITFCPDLAKFKMDTLDDDIVGLMSRRAFDVAASTGGVKVFLNGKRIPVKNFKDYVGLYIKNEEDAAGNALKMTYESPNDRWEVACTLSKGEFRQVSFVNSIATTKGGRHVDYVVDMITKQLIEIAKKKNKGGADIKPSQIKNNMWIFINCLIVNPTFDSQTKETMTLQMKSFGSKCVLSDKFINSLSKSGIVEAVLSWAKSKAEQELNKAGGKKHSKVKIAKLEDANQAGRKDALKCTLILTEGDSAKSLAVSGLGVIGRDHYGVFPLRGKLLNVREATHKQILENQEIINLVKIIGLQYHRKYNTEKDMKTLRYGKVMIMTDQDQDGSHIKGLIINFIHHNWPELLRQNFLEEFITPIVKATKRGQQFSFYSIPEFEEWKSNTPGYKTFNIKYYKGLGTSDSKEVREYFSNMTRHRIKFRYSGPQDDDNILLAFSKKHVDHRKEWLTNFMVECKRRKEIGLPDKYLYEKNTRCITYSEFVNLELVLFSNADNIRSIPSLVDGFKPGQRKVLYTCFKRNDKKEVKVAQLAGSVAEHSAYHHGEVSLSMTIVNLAQNFVGSNNINLLEPRGQFGTRLQGGKDAASARYIFTKLSPLTRMIFNAADDPLLKHEYDDNRKIEPYWYIPILPMVLVNGAEGIGTGWMTKIPNYNPREIVHILRNMLDGGEPDTLTPWYKNFRGTIEDCGDHRYVTSGEIAIVGNDEVEITELPVGTWTQNYKENVLETLLNGSEKVKAVITDYKEYNTDSTVKFVITCADGVLASLEADGLHKVFKLQSIINVAQLCVFDELGCLRRFDTVGEIIAEFYALRLKFYKKRKDYLQGYYEAEADKISNQARFIMEKCSGELVVENKKRAIIIQELITRGYSPDPLAAWKAAHLTEDDDDETEEDAEAQEETTNVKKNTVVDVSNAKKFDYLLGLSMWTLTEERKNELLRQRDQKLEELNTLKKKSPSDLWRDDLDVFIKTLDEVEEKERNDEVVVKTEKKKSTKKNIVLQETLPTPSGRRILPTVGSEIKKRIQNAVKLKENKVKKGVKKEILDNEDKDEFDMMVQNKKTLKDKLGTPDELEKKIKTKKDGFKQTKLNFKAVSNNGKDSDSDDGSDYMAPTKAVAKGKRKKIIDEDSDDLFDNISFNKSKSDTSDFEELIKTKAAKKSKVVVSDEDSDSPKKKKSKPAQKQKKADQFESKKLPKKRKGYSSDEFEPNTSDIDHVPEDSAPTRSNRPERAKKTTKYVFDSDDGESE